MVEVDRDQAVNVGVWMRFNEIGGISYQLCFGCNPFAKNIGTLKRTLCYHQTTCSI